MPAAWTSRALMDIAPELDGAQEWRPVRHELGVTTHGVNAYTGPAVGDQILDDHDEVREGHEELYVVLTGRATFTLDGEELDAPAGTLVFVADPAVRRVAHAAEPQTTILCTGGLPGAFTPSAWEENALAEAGR